MVFISSARKDTDMTNINSHSCLKYFLSEEDFALFNIFIVIIIMGRGGGGLFFFIFFKRFFFFPFFLFSSPLPGDEVQCCFTSTQTVRTE